ncbi:carbamoyltransferase C-terminal domain-containing protein [Rhizobium sp. CSW-27]|uniref:carbamoyltransferase family protein n=1 Tax=Rhizobium sp. CSW-27 TaxID=2839985 RepID=UPI001C021C16|nr:carbamoyltransferase C-terminal domain-containing protein [Rhizobium sp. CSW-27]MBT9373344.1 carbamoyltransferase [Rhizobium sp. CSW-27]
MTTWYLGLATSGHDPALAIVDETGQVVYAEATERFLQDKRAWGISPDHPPHLERALKICGASPETDTFIVGTTWKAMKAQMDVKIHDAMLPALDTLWMRGLNGSLQAMAGHSLLRLGVTPDRQRLLRHEHHLCHAVTAAWFAPLSDALVLVLDGEGDVGAVSAYALEDRALKRLWRSWGPGSLGTFYGWLTFRCGFDWRLGEEWKVMGLAAYGRVIPHLRAALQTLLTVKDGRLLFAAADRIAEVQQMASTYARTISEPPMQAADLAATGQAAYAALADAVIGDLLAQQEGPGPFDLLLCGGCALNSSYNGAVANRLGLRSLHVPPCPADDGNAIGAALLSWMQDRRVPTIPASPDCTPFLGMEAGLSGRDLRPHVRGFEVKDVSGNTAAAVAEALAQGRVVGTFRGRAEFGPRALGNRSILADPARAGMKDHINAIIKGREAYRPFAPVLRARDTADWFTSAEASPYMSKTLFWRQERQDQVQAVVHADGTGRAQTVTPEMYPWMHDLLDETERRTGQAVLLNTSFNIMGKPIIDTVEDALAVLSTTGLDTVLAGDLLISKPFG